ncbi:MAG: S-methyl-5-thioribose-1-phosphate isomerase [Pseudomonadota bacterium]
MRVNGEPFQSIWTEGDRVRIIDQTRLPFEFSIIDLADLSAAAFAIAEMQVRGAPLIGATAAFGMALAMRQAAGEEALLEAGERLRATRPTAVNLRWAVDDMTAHLRTVQAEDRPTAAWSRALAVAAADIEINRQIGQNGLPLIQKVAAKKDRVNILTHCNAGWLATVDWGTATSPIYQAHDAGIDLHVWVNETRPRNQGGHLTAWELAQHGVPHTVIVDNAGGHLMQQGAVDLCFVGTDRTAANGDVANKIGTYLKALAAQDNGVPFYVCLPSPTIDWQAAHGGEIPIEERRGEEVSHVSGLSGGEVVSCQVVNPGSPVANPAFDVTPAHLVSGLITERGVVAPAALRSLFPEAA